MPMHWKHSTYTVHTEKYFRNIIKWSPNQIVFRIFGISQISEWFGNKQTSVWFQINRNMANTIWVRFDLIIFRKVFSVCMSEESPFTLSNLDICSRQEEVLVADRITIFLGRYSVSLISKYRYAGKCCPKRSNASHLSSSVLTHLNRYFDEDSCTICI